MLQLQKSGGTFVSVVWTLPQIGSLIDCRTWWLLPKWGQKLGYLVGKHTKPVAEMLWRGKQTFPFLGFWWASSQCASIKTGQIVWHGCLLAHTCGIFAHFCEFAPHKLWNCRCTFWSIFGRFGQVWHMEKLAKVLATEKSPKWLIHSLIENAPQILGFLNLRL